MSPRTAAVLPLLFSFVCSIALLGQETPAPSAPAPPESSTSATAPMSAAARDFPIIMPQSVVLGKTPVGTEPHPKARYATLVEREVIPRRAGFSGKVIEYDPKPATDASTLSIRMDSIQWKDGSAPIK